MLVRPLFTYLPKYLQQTVRLMGQDWAMWAALASRKASTSLLCLQWEQRQKRVLECLLGHQSNVSATGALQFLSAFFFFNALLLPIDHKILEGRVFKINSWDFSTGPVAKTPCSQCKGPGFDPQSGNQIPLLHLRGNMPQIKILHAATKTNWYTNQFVN